LQLSLYTACELCNRHGRLR